MPQNRNWIVVHGRSPPTTILYQMKPLQDARCTWLPAKLCQGRQQKQLQTRYPHPNPATRSVFCQWFGSRWTLSYPLRQHRETFTGQAIVANQKIGSNQHESLGPSVHYMANHGKPWQFCCLFLSPSAQGFAQPHSPTGGKRHGFQLQSGSTLRWDTAAVVHSRHSMHRWSWKASGNLVKSSPKPSCCLCHQTCPRAEEWKPSNVSTSRAAEHHAVNSKVTWNAAKFPKPAGPWCRKRALPAALFNIEMFCHESMYRWHLQLIGHCTESDQHVSRFKRLRKRNRDQTKKGFLLLLSSDSKEKNIKQRNMIWACFRQEILTTGGNLSSERRCWNPQAISFATRQPQIKRHVVDLNHTLFTIKCATSTIWWTKPNLHVICPQFCSAAVSAPTPGKQWHVPNLFADKHTKIPYGPGNRARVWAVSDVRRVLCWSETMMFVPVNPKSWQFFWKAPAKGFSEQRGEPEHAHIFTNLSAVHTSSHLHLFFASRLPSYIFTSLHLVPFTSSTLHTCFLHPYISASACLHIFYSSHLPSHILSLPLLLFTSSNIHTWFPTSYILTCHACCPTCWRILLCFQSLNSFPRHGQWPRDATNRTFSHKLREFEASTSTVLRNMDIKTCDAKLPLEIVDLNLSAQKMDAWILKLK